MEREIEIETGFIYIFYSKFKLINYSEKLIYKYIDISSFIHAFINYLI